MKAKPPIPPWAWRRIQQFFDAGHTGDIVLQVHKGKFRRALLTERLEEETSDDGRRMAAEASSGLASGPHA